MCVWRGRENRVVTKSEEIKEWTNNLQCSSQGPKFNLQKSGESISNGTFSLQVYVERADLAQICAEILPWFQSLVGIHTPEALG